MARPRYTRATPEAKAKDWGVNRPVYRDHLTELHHASIAPGGASSVHRHDFKWNLFYVAAGGVRVEFYGDDAVPTRAPVETADLVAREQLVVWPSAWHRFVAGPDGCELIEQYGVCPVEPGDIVRYARPAAR